MRYNFDIKKIVRIIEVIVIIYTLYFFCQIVILNKIYPIPNKIFAALSVYFAVVLFLIAIHELCHLFMFKILGISVKAIFISILAVYWEDKIHFKFLKRSFFSGMVIPDIPKIETKENYYEVKNKQLIALVAGPIGSGVFAIIIMSGLQLIQRLLVAGNMYFLCYGIAFIVGLQTFSIIHKSFSNNAKDNGDMNIYKQLMSENNFYIEYLYSHLLLASDFSVKLNESYYLKEQVKRIISVNDIELSGENTKIYLLDQILLRTLAGMETAFNDKVNKILNRVSDIQNELINCKEEIYGIVLFHISQYYMIELQDLKKAQELYIYCVDNIQCMNSRVKEYYMKQTEAVLNHIYCEKISEENIYPNEGFEEWSIFKQLYIVEREVLCRQLNEEANKGK